MKTRKEAIESILQNTRDQVSFETTKSQFIDQHYSEAEFSELFQVAQHFLDQGGMGLKNKKNPISLYRPWESNVGRQGTWRTRLSINAPFKEGIDYERAYSELERMLQSLYFVQNHSPEIKLCDSTDIEGRAAVETSYLEAVSESGEHFHSWMSKIAAWHKLNCEQDVGFIKPSECGTCGLFGLEWDVCQFCNRFQLGSDERPSCPHCRFHCPREISSERPCPFCQFKGVDVPKSSEDSKARLRKLRLEREETKKKQAEAEARLNEERKRREQLELEQRQEEQRQEKQRTEQLYLKETRRANKQCILCGSPLKLFDRIRKRDRHTKCN